MEFATGRKTRGRKRKRRARNKRSVLRKFEVRSGTSRRKVISDNFTAVKEELQFNAMDAFSFWENYKISHEWQQRHSVAWWTARCRALEYENQILRQKVLDEASKRVLAPSFRRTENETSEDVDEVECESEDTDEDEDGENLEFQVDKHMLDFLEQSIRHKMELKRCRETESEGNSSERTSDETPFVTREAQLRTKMEDARLLYGEASPRIMAMEAALQATVDRHKDRAKPSYWPNIPLNL